MSNLAKTSLTILVFLGVTSNIGNARECEPIGTDPIGQYFQVGSTRTDVRKANRGLIATVNMKCGNIRGAPADDLRPKKVKIHFVFRSGIKKINSTCIIDDPKSNVLEYIEAKNTAVLKSLHGDRLAKTEKEVDEACAVQLRESFKLWPQFQDPKKVAVVASNVVSFELDDTALLYSMSDFERYNDYRRYTLYPVNPTSQDKSTGQPAAAAQHLNPKN
jgi:hypothetical protein